MPINTQDAADKFAAMTPKQYKTYEDRLRRMAKRQRLVLVKSLRRDPHAYDYGGYMIFDQRDRPIAGISPHGYSMSLGDVEKYLTDDERTARRPQDAAV